MEWSGVTRAAIRDLTGLFSTGSFLTSSLMWVKQLLLLYNVSLPGRTPGVQEKRDLGGGAQLAGGVSN